MIIAAFIPVSPAEPPTATACAISWSDAPPIVPNCASVNPRTGRNAICASANTVPMIATVATAMTSSSRPRCSSPFGMVMDPDRPMTAAAPQMPVPPAVRIARCSSTPSFLAITYVTVMVSVTIIAAMTMVLTPVANSTSRLSLKPSRMMPSRNSLLAMSPAAPPTPCACRAPDLANHARIGICRSMPMISAMMSAPNRLNAGRPASKDPTTDAAQVTSATSSISVVQMALRNVLILVMKPSCLTATYQSNACLQCLVSDFPILLCEPHTSRHSDSAPRARCVTACANQLIRMVTG